MKNGLLAISLIILGGNISACATGPSSTHWKEEVLLHDGSKIVAKRDYNVERNPSKGYVLLDETVTFNLPGGKSVVWKNEVAPSIAQDLDLYDPATGTGELEWRQAA